MCVLLAVVTSLANTLLKVLRQTTQPLRRPPGSLAATGKLCVDSWVRGGHYVTFYESLSDQRLTEPLTGDGDAVPRSGRVEGGCSNDPPPPRSSRWGELVAVKQRLSVTLWEEKSVTLRAHDVHTVSLYLCG